MNPNLDFQRKQDQDHLNTLNILWWIAAALYAMGLCIGTIYSTMGGLLFGIGGIASARDGGVGALPGVIVAMMGCFFLFIFGGLSYCAYRVGASLRDRKNYNFAFIVGCVVCLSFPLGTALGVFTLIVLSRPTVKELFGVTSAPINFGSTYVPPQQQQQAPTQQVYQQPTPQPQPSAPTQPTQEEVERRAAMEELDNLNPPPPPTDAS